VRFDRSPHAQPAGYRVVDAGARGDARSWMDLSCLSSIPMNCSIRRALD